MTVDRCYKRRSQSDNCQEDLLSILYRLLILYRILYISKLANNGERKHLKEQRYYAFLKSSYNSSTESIIDNKTNEHGFLMSKEFSRLL